MSDEYYRKLSEYLKSGQWREDIKLGYITAPTAYNLIAQWVLADPNTNMEFSPKSVGLE